MRRRIVILTPRTFKDEGVRLRGYYGLHTLAAVLSLGITLTASGLVGVFFFGLGVGGPLAADVAIALGLMCGPAVIVAALLTAAIEREDVREEWREWRRCVRAARKKRMDDIYGALGR